MLEETYAKYTPEVAEQECGVAADVIVDVAREIGKAGSAFASHVWRNAASGNLGGWQVARCLQFLTVLVGAVGTPGGTNLNTQNKFVPPPFLQAAAAERLERAALSRASGRSRTTSSATCCRTCCSRAAARSRPTSRASTTRSGPTPTA